MIPESIGSDGGIRAVSTGINTLARVARSLTLEEQNAGLVYLPFAKEPVVFAVGRNVNITNLTTGQLVNIFTGKTKKWSTLGGIDRRIRVAIREPDDSSLRIIKKFIPAFSHINFSPDARVVVHDSSMKKLLIKYRQASGWLTKSSLRDTNIRAVGLNGINPTLENVKNGRYRLVSEYALVYKQKSLSATGRLFIDFVNSGKARKILTNSGLVPVKEAVIYEAKK